MALISKIVGTMLIFGTLLAVWIDERSYLAKSLRYSRDNHEIAKTEQTERES